jgi:hypothetical protein
LQEEATKEQGNVGSTTKKKPKQQSYHQSTKLPSEVIDLTKDNKVAHRSDDKDKEDASKSSTQVE